MRRLNVGSQPTRSTPASLRCSVSLRPAPPAAPPRRPGEPMWRGASPPDSRAVPGASGRSAS
eukprot:14003040-Alexandrium_andersonii.AAC.1